MRCLSRWLACFLIGPPIASAQSRQVTVIERRETFSTTTVDIDIFSTFRRNKSPEKILTEKGPQFPLVFNMSSFQVVGFAKGNWPMVLDYELLPGTLGLVTVTSEGIEPYYYRLDPQLPGRQLIRLQLPARFGNPPRIGTYSVGAFADAAGELQPAMFRVYGIGAGERAVGSIALEDLKFGPPEIFPQRKDRDNKASYSFHPKNPFDKFTAEFVRVGLSGGRIFTADGQHRLA
jgi:hypothetical protein